MNHKCLHGKTCDWVGGVVKCHRHALSNSGAAHTEEGQVGELFVLPLHYVPTECDGGVNLVLDLDKSIQDHGSTPGSSEVC